MGREKGGRLSPFPRFPPSHHTPRATKKRQRERETTGDESVPNPNQVMSGESSRLPHVLFKVISKVQSLYIKQRFAKGVQRNITDLINNYR